MEVKTYRKKPVVIEAIEWTGENIDEIAAFLGWRNFSYDKQHGLRIHTLEGTHDATVTDMIIKGVKGEFYPCKADIFAATYDHASPTHTVSNMGVDARRDVLNVSDAALEADIASLDKPDTQGLRELVERAREIVPEFYVNWHAAARTALNQESR